MKSELETQESYISRNQSPQVETIMHEMIYDTLKALLEGSYLYQNRSIDLSAITAKADVKFSVAALEDEFQYRPWTPFSRNRGFTTSERQLLNTARGCDPLGIPAREMRLMFIIPTIETWC